jgi:hypothetical protein
MRHSRSSPVRSIATALPLDHDLGNRRGALILRSTID